MRAGWRTTRRHGYEAQCELALEGTCTGEQRWLLEKELGQVERLEAQVESIGSGD